MDPKMQFASIPPGIFLMGGNGQDDNPQHRVKLTKGFNIGIFPVTQAQWLAVMGTNPSNYPGDDRPVETISFADADAFCQKMAAVTGNPIRLPTEAEWEYACRAGTTSAYWIGDGPDALKKAGWFGGNTDGKQTKPVGLLARNPWGLYDVHGNVFEMCQDWCAPLTASDQVDPTGSPSATGQRVIRGGSFYSAPQDCFSAARCPCDVNFIPNGMLGLRVCYTSGG